MQHELRYMKISYQFLSRSHLKLGIQKHCFFFKSQENIPRPSHSSGDLPFEIFFPGISALIDSQESQITKENRGVWQATDAHADSDPKILGLHVQCP